MSNNQSLFAEITPNEEANLSGGYNNASIRSQTQPQYQIDNVGQIANLQGGTQTSFTFIFN